MSKVSFDPATMLAPLPVVMVSVGDMEKSNIITIAWTGVINSNPPYTYVSIRKERFSHDIVDENKEFVINLVNEELVRATDFCGVKSGKDIDKFKETGLHKIKGDCVNCPMILESPINLECKVIEKHEYPSHDMFLAEVKNVHVSSEYILPDGKIDYMKMGLVSYVHGEYVPLRKVQTGFFGYSVARKKVLKKRSKIAHDRRVNSKKKHK